MTVASSEVDRPKSEQGKPEESLFTKKRICYLGRDRAVAYGACGEKVDNQTLIDRYVGDDPQAEKLAQSIDDSGITERHQGFLSIEDQIEATADITRDALAAVRRGRVDFLAVTFSRRQGDYSPKEFAQAVAEKAGLDDATVVPYCLACDGAVAAIHDLLQTKDPNINIAAVTSVEILSPEINLSEGEVDLTEATLFGNGAASFVFSPPDFELLNGKTVIIPDHEGVIKVAKGGSPQLPGRETHLRPPSWYRLEEDAEKIFAYSADGVIMTLQETETKYGVMDGIGTAWFFKRAVPLIAFEVLKEYYDELGTDQPVTRCISHQPSKPVLRHISRELNKMLKSAGYPPVEVLWVLDEVRMGNVSSVTPLLAIAHQLNGIPDGEPFLMLGFGVGAAVTGMVVKKVKLIARTVLVHE
jgi:3-oxoacyl-[acyl-carrier-protein] synthase III